MSNVCANLDTNVASVLGGVCPNITHGVGGEALLWIQLFFVVYFVVFNIYSTFSQTQSSSKNTSLSSDFDIDIAAPTDKSLKKNFNSNNTVKRPLSVYYQKKY